VRRLAAGAVFAALAGCFLPTPTSYPKEAVGGIPSAPRIEMPVRLVIDADLRATQWRRQPGSASETELGKSLAVNAEAVARAVFARVDVVSDPKEGAADVALLTPRVVAVEKVEEGDYHGERMTVLLEWSLRDPEGRPIWVETVRGSQLFTKPARTLVEQLVRTSFEQLSGSREIRAYAASRSAPLS
jgi:hypothetical protein